MLRDTARRPGPEGRGPTPSPTRVAQDEQLVAAAPPRSPGPRPARPAQQAEAARNSATSSSSVEPREERAWSAGPCGTRPARSWEGEASPGTVGGRFCSPDQVDQPGAGTRPARLRRLPHAALGRPVGQLVPHRLAGLALLPPLLQRSAMLDLLDMCRFWICSTFLMRAIGLRARIAEHGSARRRAPIRTGTASSSFPDLNQDGAPGAGASGDPTDDSPKCAARAPRSPAPGRAEIPGQGDHCALAAASGLLARSTKCCLEAGPERRGWRLGDLVDAVVRASSRSSHGSVAAVMVAARARSPRQTRTSLRRSRPRSSVLDLDVSAVRAAHVDASRSPERERRKRLRSPSAPARSRSIVSRPARPQLEAPAPRRGARPPRGSWKSGAREQPSAPARPRRRPRGRREGAASAEGA